MTASSKGTETIASLRLRVLILSLSFWLAGCVGPGRPIENSLSRERKDEVTEVRLDNGMTVLLKEEHKNHMVAVNLRVAVGSSTEGEFAGSGIAHLIEHMLFKGTKLRGPGELQKEIESLGGSINAFTSLDDTSFELNAPSEHFEQALSLLADAIINSTFDEAQLTLEKDVILNEMRLNEDDPQRYLRGRFWERAYIVHTYKYPVIGHKELFRNITQGECLAFYKENYIPQNMVLAVVGDIQREEAIEKVKFLFKDLRPHPQAPRALPIEPEQIASRMYEETRAASLAYIMMGFHSVQLNDEELFPLDVLAVLLGQGEGSRLDVSLRKKSKLVYSIEAWNYTPKYPGLFLIACLTEHESKDAIVKAIFEELSEIKKGGPTPTELDSAKERIISDYLFSREILQAGARDLASNYALTGDWNFSSKYVAGIKEVGAEEIRRAAEKYLRPENFTLFTLRPDLKESEGTSGAAEIKGDVKEITRIQLPNGMRLLLKEDHTHPIVTIRAAFKGGVRFEDEKNNGISNLTAGMLIKGTKKYPASVIAKKLDSIGARLDALSGNNTFGFRLEIQSKNIKEALTLVKDIILNPTFPEEEMILEKERTQAAIKARDDDIFDSTSLALKMRLFTAHPYRFDPLGSRDVLEALQREDLLEFFAKNSHPEDIVIGIFGDISTEYIKKELSSSAPLLGLKRRRSPEPVIMAQSEVSKQVRIDIAKEKEQALIMLGFLGTTVENRDRYSLEIITAVLSGGGGRLYERLREKSALAYTTGAYSVPGIEPGYIIVYAAVPPSQSERARNELFDELERLKREPIVEEELQRARRYLAGMQEVGLQTNSMLAEIATLDELYGLGYDNYKRYKSALDSITPSDLKSAVERYLDLGRAIVVVTKPSE